MSITFLYQMAIIPALLITLTGMILLRRNNDEKAKQGFLIFCLVAEFLLLITAFLASPGYDETARQYSFEIPNLLMPSLIGILALVMIHLRQMGKLNLRWKVAAVLLLLGIGIFFVLLVNTRLAVEYYVLPGAILLLVFWLLGRRFDWSPVAIGLLAVVNILLFNRVVQSPSVTPPIWISYLFMALGYMTPVWLVVMPALLITKSLEQPLPGGQTASSRSTRLGIILRTLLAALFIGVLVYVILWGGIWDQTEDMGFGFLLFPIAGILAIATGMVMTATLQGRSRIGGLLYMILIPLLVYQSYEAGTRISYHELTESRAEQIAAALEKYHERVGQYPDDLRMLTPRTLLFVPQPVIMLGERWCYQGGGDYYQLSAFYREFWGMPVSLRVYESAGDLPAGPVACEDRLAEMKKKHYSSMEDPSAAQPPLPTPLPENEVEISKTEVSPMLDGVAAMPGSWSPDSAYFFFGTQTTELSLHFLIGETGEICTVSETFAPVDRLWEHHIWLRDGRLLFLDSAGKMAAIAPCQADVEWLDEHFPATFTQIATSSQDGRRILLKSDKAYWIMDGQTLTAQNIPEVTPTPYEAHWDTFDWLPDNESLVIARLNGRKGSRAGSTLYLIDGRTGQVKKSLLLQGDFGQSSPWVEGISDHEVLVHGLGELLIIDFSADQPKMVNVLADVFGLDIKYPEDASAAGSYIMKDGSGYYLAVRLNHPRDHATYLFDARTGQIHVYNHEYHTLLLFPDGYLMEMPKLEDVPTYRDEYDIVLVDQPEAVQPRLKLTGHTPREYPTLNIVYLRQASELGVASAQGVSLVSLSNGEMVAYWELPGDGFSPFLMAAPDGSALIASKDHGGLYYIPLPPRK